MLASLGLLGVLSASMPAQAFGPADPQPFPVAKFQGRVAAQWRSPIDVLPTHDVLHYSVGAPGWFDYVLCQDEGGAAFNSSVADATAAMTVHGIPWSQLGSTRTDCWSNSPELFKSMLCDAATGRCDANPEHVIYFVNDVNSPVYTKFKNYVENTMGGDPVITAGVGVAREHRRKEALPSSGILEAASWAVIINGVNYDLSNEPPATTDTYAIG